MNCKRKYCRFLTGVGEMWIVEPLTCLKRKNTNDIIVINKIHPVAVFHAQLENHHNLILMLIKLIFLIN